MNYLEAKSKSEKYKIDEYDFKHTSSFIFAIEFLEEEELQQERRIKSEKEHKEFLQGHDFDINNKCTECGINKYKYISLRERPTCYEVRIILQKTNSNILQIENFLQERHINAIYS